MISHPSGILSVYLLLVACSLPAEAAPYHKLRKRAITISVLKASSSVINGCTDTQITSINTAIAEGRELAETATLALVNPKIQGSTNFKNFMGASNNPTSINLEHFLPITATLNTPSKEVDNLDGLGADDLTYVCPPANDCGSGNPGQVTASTRNFNSAKDPADVRNRNLIQFCPVFFGSNPKQPPQSLTEAVAKLQTQTAFEVVPAMAIVHEAQHSIPIVGSTARVRDLKVTDPKDGKTKKAYSLRLTSNVLSDSQKIQNAQNFAWFALFAKALPNQNTDTCSAAAAPVAGATTGKKTTPAPAAKVPRTIAQPLVLSRRVEVPEIPPADVAGLADDLGAATKGLGSDIENGIKNLNPFGKSEPAPAKVAPPAKAAPPKEETPTEETAGAATTEAAAKTTAAETKTKAAATSTEAVSTSTSGTTSTSAVSATTTSASSSSKSSSETSTSASSSASPTPSSCAAQSGTFDSLTLFNDEDEDADGDLAD